LNHIGVWVDNIEAAVSELTGKGVRFAPGGIRKGAGKCDLQTMDIVLLNHIIEKEIPLATNI
jgi:lactoylglutathione lyase